MKRFWTYCFFFGISLLIHLFLFLDFFQLPSSPTLRSWEEKIFSKARQFLQVQTSPTNSLPTTPDPKASASLVSSAIPHSIKDSASSELEHAFEEELTPSSKKTFLSAARSSINAFDSSRKYAPLFFFRI